MATGQEIWDRGVEYADMTGSSFPTSVVAVRLAFVNDALSELYYMLAAANPDWFHAEQSITGIAGTDGYTPSPDNIYRVKQVYIRNGSKRYIVPRFQHGVMDGWEFAPIEGATLNVLYTPEYTALTAISGAISTDFPPGWENYAALQIAMAQMTREESDVSAISQMLETKRAQIMTHAEVGRDVAEADTIVDKSHRFDPMPWSRVVDVVPDYYYRMQGRKLYLVQPDVTWA